MNLLNEFENYLKENFEKDEEQNTIKNYLSDVKQFIEFFEKQYGEEVTTFNHIELSEYINYMKNKKNYKFTTMNRKIAAISNYDDFLIETKRKDSKAVRNKDYFKIQREHITADMLPTNTINKIKLRAAKDNSRDYAMFVLYDEGGFRCSELLGIVIDRDIDFQMRKIQVIGKGSKIRKVTMNDKMKNAIEEYLVDREKLLNGRKNKYLFVSNKTANSGKRMGRTSVNNILNSYCDKVKEEKIKPHMLRHDFATKSYNLGYTDLMLKIELGHSSNATSIYTHPGQESLLDLSNKR